MSIKPHDIEFPVDETVTRQIDENFDALFVSPGAGPLQATNGEAQTLVIGQPVYLSSGSGSRPVVKLAKADADATMPAIGLVAESILPGEIGRIAIDGELTYDTTDLALGVVYVSSTTAGAVTGTAPSTRAQVVGIVVGVGVTGTVLVSIQGVGADHEILSALHTDSNTSTLIRGDLITAQAASPKWDRLAVGATAGMFLRSDATDTGWSTLVLPNAATIGDLLMAATTDTYASLADIATGNVLLSKGVGVAPAYGTVNLATGVVTGLLPFARGGTGISNTGTGRLMVGSGSTTWAQLSPGANNTFFQGQGTGSTPAYVAKVTAIGHAMLDASVHTDSVADGVTRGSIIYGNATPKWDELVVGAADRVLVSDGTDIAWSGTAGVLASGTPANNYLAHWTGAGAITGDAFLTWDDAILEVRGAVATPGHLKLTTAETTVVDTDILGRIDFQAPLESDGSDAILVPASIHAVAGATFSATVNTTDLVFSTATSSTAVERGRMHGGGGFSWGDSLDPGDTNMRVAGTFIVVGTSGHVFGASSTSNNTRQQFTGSFTSGGVVDFAMNYFVDGTLTGASGDTNFLVGSRYSSSITTQGAAEVIGMCAQLRIEDPGITIGTATVTSSTVLWIPSIASEATNNWAVAVDAGNISLGATSAAPSGTFGIVFGDGTALTSMGTNTAGFYANDVSTVVEMFGIDEGDTASQLTPHNFTLFTPDPNEPFPWSYYSRNPHLGIEINVDLAKLARLVEQLVPGEKIIHTRALPPNQRLDWMDKQRVNVAKMRQAYEDWERARDGVRPDLAGVAPTAPRVKHPPAWMLSRLKAQGKWDEEEFGREIAALAQWQNRKPGRGGES